MKHFLSWTERNKNEQINTNASLLAGSFAFVTYVCEIYSRCRISDALSHPLTKKKKSVACNLFFFFFHLNGGWGLTRRTLVLIFYNSICLIVYPQLEFVNSVVNVCSSMIGCFEVVPLAPVPILIQVRAARNQATFFSFFFSGLEHCQARSFCFVSTFFIRLRLLAVFLKQGGLSKRPISRLC